MAEGYCIEKTALGNRFMVGPQISRLALLPLFQHTHTVLAFCFYLRVTHELFVDTIVSLVCDSLPYIMSVSLSTLSLSPKPEEGIFLRNGRG